MTMLGKILVFVTFGLSLAMATWAIGVYSNRIDFSDAKAKGLQTAGEYEKRRVVIEALNKDLPPAEAALRSAGAALADQETRLLADRVWYHGQLEHMQEKATDRDPVQQIVYADRGDEGGAKGLILLNKEQRPVLAPAKDRLGNPLLSLKRYDEDEQKLLADLDDIQTQHEKNIQEAIRLTNLLIGGEGTKGLHERLLAERTKREEVVAEKGLMEPLLINTTVDAALVNKRHRQLVARIEELKKVGVAARDR
jgi:hypothetical protein